jgi:hypothetical protein
LFQQPLLLAVGLVVLVIGTPSETGMTEVEEDRLVCLACQALHFQAIYYCSRCTLSIHMTKSKNPKFVQEWSRKYILSIYNVVYTMNIPGI